VIDQKAPRVLIGSTSSGGVSHGFEIYRFFFLGSFFVERKYGRMTCKMFGLVMAGLLAVTGPIIFVVSAKAGGVPEPETYRLKDYRAPVPLTLKGAQVIDAGVADQLWDNGKGDVIFIDVYPKPPKPANLPKNTIWREPKHNSIKGAYWLANVGFGVLAPKFDTYFREGLKRLTGADMEKRLVFFCKRDCWMSWNAGKRALSYGYKNVIWFPDGTDGWEDFGLPLVVIKPQP